VAALTVDQRVEIQGDVLVDGQLWVISRFPVTIGDEVGFDYLTSAGVDPTGGELLLIDDGAIARAISMQGAPPTWIVSDGQVVFAGRLGDGGYPSSAVVRVDLATGATSKKYLPASYAWRDPGSAGRSGELWDVVDPDGNQLLLDASLAAINPSNESAGDDAIADLAHAFERAETFDWSIVPAMAMQRGPCTDISGYAGGLLYDFGRRCVAQLHNPSAPNSTVAVGGSRFAGRLVGAGSMDSSGATYAAIVQAASPGTNETEVLVFVDLNDPKLALDTGISGRDEGSEVAAVSFFEGGFVTTRRVDQAIVVQAYDSSFVPLDGFVSPTNRDLGYPPNPFVDFALASPDGKRLVFIERNWPVSGAGDPGRQTAVIVTDLATGTRISEFDFELETDEFVRWVDYDGRWVLVSLERSSTEGEPAAQPFSFLIDTKTSTRYPLGIDDTQQTFERQPAG